ncbi:hypothetical protein D3C87_1330160 [compost metagenome]
MKTMTVKMMGIAFLLSLSACVETTSPVCNKSNLIDVTKFAGDYQSSLLMDPSTDVVNQNLKIVRKALGRYELQVEGQNSEVAVCQVGAYKIAEFSTKYGTFQQSVISKSAEGPLAFSQWIIDAKTLDAAKIPYEIVEREADGLAGLKVNPFEEEPAKRAVLVINNSDAASAKTLSQKAVPSAMSMLVH